MFFLEREIEMRLENFWREAEKRRLLREVRTIQRWRLPRPGRCLLRQLGRLMVSVGQRLQGYGQPQTILLNRSINGGAFAGNGE
jgi:hypothetical protein